MRDSRTGAIAFSILLVASTTYLGFRSVQIDFWSILVPYALAFGAYLFFVLRSDRMPTEVFKIGIGLAILVRVILLFAFPRLSDDVYRFYWDGLCLLEGYNPYVHIPADLVSVSQDDLLSSSLFEKLNSPEWYSVYPPINQAIFGLGAWLSPKSILGFSIVLKLFLFLGELLTFWLGIKVLELLRLRQERILLYALNPLIIVEIMGNMHFEGLVVMSMSVVLWGVLRSREKLASIGWALAAGIKLVPIMLLPAMWRVLWPRKMTVWTWIYTGILLVLFLGPLVFGGALNGFSDSLDLYFRTFEFNASVYYILRKLGVMIYGWNQIAYIGPGLSLVVALWILYYSFKTCKDRHPRCWISAMVVIYSIYLFCSTTIHPWYLSVILFLSIFTRFRFAYTWSLLVILSYFHYHKQSYSESMALIGFQYGVVILSFIWEWSRDCSLVNLLMDEEIEDLS